MVKSTEGEPDCEGEREACAEGLAVTEGVEVVVGVGRCVAEGREVGELVPRGCTAPARGATPDTLVQSAPGWQGPAQVEVVCPGPP